MAIHRSSEGSDSVSRQAYAGSREVLPVALLIGERPCLVVGGGKVGTRKALLLLAAKADVRVVAPAVSEELAELAAAGSIQWEQRGFCDADVVGMAVVFAATDDEALNRHIVGLCRSTHTLTCAVDRHWSEGDFVTPATIREGGMCVSITSGGKSCRRSRLLKETLGRHLALVEQADLFVLGTSHQELALEEREPFHLVGERLHAMGTMLRQVSGLHEFCLLNTCNRVELLAVASPETVDCGILARLLGFASLPPDGYYVKRGYDAFLHSTLVTSGLLSQTPGEKHIVAQLKQALGTATEAGWCGSLVGEWLESALHVAKHVRQTAEAKRERLEIEDICLAYLHSRPEPLSRSVLVLGTGDVGRGLVERLLTADANPIWCYHRHRPVLPAAWAERVTRVPWEQLRDWLPQVDVVLCASGGDQYVLGSEVSACFAPDRPTTIVDLGMPRNVAPQLAAEVPQLVLADLDDLKHWWSRQDGEVAARIAHATAITAEHRSSYDRLLASLQNRDPLQ